MRFVKQLIAAAAIATVAGGAMAQEAEPDTWLNVALTKTRAQVMAELKQARHEGTVEASKEGYDFIGRSVAMKSRDQVRAELFAARASGEFDVINGPVYNFGPIHRTSAYASAAAKTAQ